MYDGVVELICGIKTYYDGGIRLGRIGKANVVIVRFPLKFFNFASKKAG